MLAWMATTNRTNKCICSYSLGVQLLKERPRLSLPGSVLSLVGCNQVLVGCVLIRRFD